LSTVSRWFIGNNNEDVDSTSNFVMKGRSTATGNLIRKLENDKESLALQVSVLTDQLDAQLDKVKELESHLQVKEKELEAAEIKSKEKQSRSGNKENSAELSLLKVKINALEKEKLNLELSLTTAQADFAKNQQKLSEKDLEITDLKLKLKNKSSTGSSTTLDTDYEVEKLRKIVESLLKSGKEKDRTIDDLRDTLNRFKRIQDLVLDAHESRKKLDTESDFDDSQSLASGLHFNDAFSLNSRNTPIRDFMGSPPISPGATSTPNSPVPTSNISSPKMGQHLHEVSSKPPIYPSQPPYPAPIYKLSPSNSQSNLSSYSTPIHQQHIPLPQYNPSPNAGHAFQPFNPQSQLGGTSPIHTKSPQNHRSASVSLLDSSNEEVIHPPKPSKTPPPSQTYGVSSSQFNSSSSTLPRGFSPPSARSYSYSEKSVNSSMLSPSTPGTDKKLTRSVL
jgi:hypothetical protein